MTDNAYANRQISQATIDEMTVVREAGPFSVRCKGRIHLNPIDVLGLGPSAEFELSFDVAPETPIEDVQRLALARGCELLRRVADEPLEALQAKLSEALV